MNGKLVLEDGGSFSGRLLFEAEASGEIVFNTAMAGYQEALTDASYCNQILTLTYPLIGNYGMAEMFNQSRTSFVAGLIAHQLCEKPSNWQSENSLVEFLRINKIPCLYDVDVRAITRRVRSTGAVRGVIVKADTEQAEIDELFSAPVETKLVRKVTTPKIYRLDETGAHVAILDLGIKNSVISALNKKGNLKLTVVPAYTNAAEILKLNPDGVFLSNGPGDPKDIPEIVETVKALLGKKPIFGICLGHQVLALALGGGVYKLKFGHCGVNHPVKDLSTGRVYITEQNHWHTVNEESLKDLDVVVTHRSLNDSTVEGIKHKNLPVYSIQYYPELAGSGENSLFGDFLALLNQEMKKTRGTL